MRKIFIFLFLVVALIACNHNESLKLVKFNGEAQGTYYAITYYDKSGTNYQIQFDSILDAFDHCASLWDTNSIISLVNKNDTSVILDEYS